MRVRPFHPADQSVVVGLWEACGLTRPWNDPARDIDRKLTTQPELFLVGEDETGTVVATGMVGYDGHRGWVHYLAVAPSRRGERLGRALMAEAERLLVERGCPKLNLMVRGGNENVVGFYRAIGYGIDDVVLMSKRLIPDI
jgi:ribosomal protein S18 acetylase RimI-like enzyme